ncbi:nucleotide pyrophosphohydrolase [Tuwongella immobilis]|uniref:MazG nucleotide pyrophosphohydrolase family protein n=1 Tax=Tuwongella immobilis TaxID=692036 RepID=A0A6C2YL18_9BACT|nr:nucleotide pyrophosphohydrolase [Tuwongella immobilis]VIP02074.1 MazG nucleotide pyrophosphohydrolase family protein OS=Opitutaceae bacterium TAV1 GN=OpiT1DRAFT_02576 PE=4 SV=1 [Tuwongella immobilis]VTS00309.1 MazG nucleotide pyrophosphohydrolase family protein OS=Opitutaceae bacterium TAV1 GN=OpiT1DRAFT_02576 PE=4 SV=1 [Tuwongella immobilis]
MSDQTTTIADLKQAVRAFALARNWDPYHAPKNVAMALACEAAELMEHFLWLTPEESRAKAADPAHREAIADEVADVAGLVLQFCIQTGMDLATILQAKIEKNARKYPAPESLGGDGREMTESTGDR